MSRGKMRYQSKEIDPGLTFWDSLAYTDSCWSQKNDFFVKNEFIIYFRAF